MSLVRQSRQVCCVRQQTRLLAQIADMSAVVSNSRHVSCGTCVTADNSAVFPVASWQFDDWCSGNLLVCGYFLHASQSGPGWPSWASASWSAGLALRIVSACFPYALQPWPGWPGWAGRSAERRSLLAGCDGPLSGSGPTVAVRARAIGQRARQDPFCDRSIHQNTSRIVFASFRLFLIYPNSSHVICSEGLPITFTNQCNFNSFGGVISSSAGWQVVYGFNYCCGCLHQRITKTLLLGRKPHST